MANEEPPRMILCSCGYQGLANGDVCIYCEAKEFMERTKRQILYPPVPLSERFAYRVSRALPGVRRIVDMREEL